MARKDSEEPSIPIDARTFYPFRRRVCVSLEILAFFDSSRKWGDTLRPTTPDGLMRQHKKETRH